MTGATGPVGVGRAAPAPAERLLGAARALALAADSDDLLAAIVDGAAAVRTGAAARLQLREAGYRRPVAATPADAARLGADPRCRRHHLELRAGAEPLGDLELILPADAPPLDADERWWLAMYAEQAALALRVRRLAATVERQHEGLDVARREIVECARLLALGHLVSDVVHEASNVFGTLTLAIEALLDDPGDAGTAAQVQALHAHCRHVASLLGDLRRFSRAAGRGEVGLDLDAAIDRLIRLRQLGLRARGVTVERVRLTPLPEFSADRCPLEHALLALLLSAEEALAGQPGGGTIRVTTGTRRERNVTRVRVTVEDDGPPVPPELLPRLFDPFARRLRPRGPSAALAAAHAMVAAQGGTLTAANRSDRGVVLHLELPLPPP